MWQTLCIELCKERVGRWLEQLLKRRRTLFHCKNQWPHSEIIWRQSIEDEINITSGSLVNEMSSDPQVTHFVNVRAVKFLSDGGWIGEDSRCITPGGWAQNVNSEQKNSLIVTFKLYDGWPCLDHVTCCNKWLLRDFDAFYLIYKVFYPFSRLIDHTRQ